MERTSSLLMIKEVRKKTMKLHFSPIIMAQTKGNKQCPEQVRKACTYTLLAGVQIGTLPEGNLKIYMKT